MQHFNSSILDAWRFSVFAKLPERKGFLGGEYADFQGSLQQLNSSHLRVLERIPSWQGQEDIPCCFCGKRDGDGHLFWECTFLPPSSMSGNFLSLLRLCLLIAADGLGIFFGMVGCLGLVVLVTMTLGLPHLVNKHAVVLSRCLGAYPVDFAGWSPPEYWDADDVALEMSDHPDIWTDGSRE